MKKKFLLLAIGYLLFAGCASKSFVQQEIRRSEAGTLAREVKVKHEIAQLSEEVTSLKIDTQNALSLANRALWKVKVIRYKIVEEKEIFFAFDEYRLNPTAKKLLDSLSSSLSDDLSLTITGHTDKIGSEGYNLNLGRNRAEEVQRYLVEKWGISPHRISCMTFGESKPLGEDRAKDRRVVLQIWKPE